LRKNNTSDS